MGRVKQLRIGLLGASRIAPQAIINPAKQLSGISVDAIAARDGSRAASYAARYDIARAYEGYSALIEDPNIDLIYNALPPSGHAALSIQALEAGKHVLCEKPLAMNVAEAEAMTAAGKRAERRLIEAFHYRYHPAFDHCLSLLHSGEIGELQKIEAVFNVAIPFSPQELRHHPNTGGGAMMDLGCYPLNWVLTVAGEAASVILAQAQATPAGVDESMQATLSFPSGVSAEISCTMAEGTPFRADMTVYGDNGALYFHNPLTPHDGGFITWENAQGKHRYAADSTTTYQWQLAGVLHGLQTGAVLATEGESMLQQQAALDGIYHAAGLGGLRNPAD